MDNITVDVGLDSGVSVGDEAVLIGAQGPERILAEEVARRLGHDQLRGDVRAHAAGGAILSVALDVAREALRGERAWVVGGAVRDRLLGRPVARPRHRGRR